MRIIVSANVCLQYILLTPSPFHCLSCIDGWALHGDTCYVFESQNKLGFTAALLHCRGLGETAVLASASTPELNNFLPIIMDDIATAWLGGFLVNQQWTWLDGSTFGTGAHGWAPNQPDLSENACVATQNVRDTAAALI